MREEDRYLDNGYINVGAILDSPENEVYIVGARGIGKTYGILKACVERGLKFLHVRRLAVQCDMIGSSASSEFTRINMDMGWNIGPVPVNKVIKGYCRLDEDGKPVDGQVLGYLMALKTAGNVTGFYMQDVDILFYDEFIAKPGEAQIKNENLVLQTLIETVQRNRELDGGKPLKVICAANSNTYDSDILISQGLVRPLMRLNAEGRHIWSSGSRLLLNYDDSPISKRKMDTDLYRRNQGTRFSDIAISNDFPEKYLAGVKSEPLREYRPLCVIGELCIYRHKSKSLYYATTHISGSPERYPDTAVGRTRWARNNPDLWAAYLHDHIRFEEPLCELLFCKYCGFSS